MRRLNVNFILGIYLGIVVWWFSLYISGTKDTSIINGFSAVWGVLGTIFAVILFAKTYSIIFKTFNFRLCLSLMFILFGFILWTLGNNLWISYNIFLGIDIPFPSTPDILFICSYPFVLFGVLINFTSINKFNYFRIIISKIVLLFAFILAFFGVLYYLKSDTELLKNIINIYYICFDVVTMFFLIILFIKESLSTLIEVEYSSSLVLAFLSVLFYILADASFYFLTSINSYSNAGIADLFYVISNLFMLMLSIKLLRFLYPPFKSEYLFLGPNCLIQLPYVRQMSLNCIQKILIINMSVILIIIVSVKHLF